VDIPLIDSHVHLWDPGRLRYAWLDDVPPLNRPYLLPDYDQSRGSHTVEKIVYVQCEAAPTQMIDEVKFITDLAAGDDRLAAIVARAEVEHGNDVRKHLDALQEFPLVRGVRRLLESEEDPAFAAQSSFIEGVQALADYDYSFDICLQGDEQFASAVTLVDRCPNVRFVLDHIGKPDIKNARMDPWRKHLRALAAMDNVHCKLSGLVTEADHENWTPDDLKPYIHEVLDAFEEDRLMFGSDWPVLELASTSNRWITTLNEATSDLNETTRKKLFHDNARNFYQLD